MPACPSVNPCLGLWRVVAVGLWASLGMGSAHADVWAFVDEQGQIHTATHQVDARYQRVTGGAGATPTPAVQALPSSAGVPVMAEPMTRPSLGRRRNESAEAWMVRLNAAPAVRSLQPLLREVAKASGVDPLLIKAVIAVESGFNPQAVSPQGALGLMQIMPDTADRFATPSEKQLPAAERLLDPRTNVVTGARVLADLARRFDRIDLILAAWNAGEGAVRKHGGLPPIDETQKHVLQVLELYWALLQQQTPPGAASTPR